METVDVRWLTADEQALWRAYLDVSRRLNERLNKQLIANADLSIAEYEILVQLSEHPERSMRMSDLAQAAVNSRSRLTHTVARMEAQGLVRRLPCPADGRGVIAELTPQGFQVIQAAAPGHVETVRAAMFDPLTPAEVQELRAALEKIQNQLLSDEGTVSRAAPG